MSELFKNNCCRGIAMPHLQGHVRDAHGLSNLCQFTHSSLLVSRTAHNCACACLNLFGFCSLPLCLHSTIFPSDVLFESLNVTRTEAVAVLCFRLVELLGWQAIILETAPEPTRNCICLLTHCGYRRLVCCASLVFVTTCIMQFQHYALTSCTAPLPVPILVRINVCLKNSAIAVLSVCP